MASNDFEFECVWQKVKREMESEDAADAPRSKRQRASTSSAQKLCKISGEPAENKSVYCGRFKRAYESIYRSVSKNRPKLKDATKAEIKQWEDNDPQYQAWLAVFGPSGDEALEAKVLLDFVDKFPDSKQKGKSRGSIDLTVYTKSEGIRGENNKIRGRPLLDWELFSHKMASKRGWSKEKAYQQWEALKADRSIERDEGGPASCRLRLAVPAYLVGKDMLEEKTSHFTQQEIKHTSKASKTNDEAVQQAREDMVNALDPELQRLPAAGKEMPLTGIWAGASDADLSVGSSVEKLLLDAASTSQGSPMKPSSESESMAPSGLPTPTKEKEKEKDKDKSAKNAKTDVPSLRNTALALQSRELASLEKRFEDQLKDGAAAIKASDVTQDADFLEEAQRRMQVGYAMLGKLMQRDGTDVNIQDIPDDQSATEKMQTFMSDHFCLVSNKDHLASFKDMKLLVIELKLKTTKEGLEETVQKAQGMKEQASELLGSIGVAVKDLKKHHRRRQADAAKAESQEKKHLKAQEQEKASQEVDEVKRSTLLAAWQVPFTISISEMQAIPEIASMTEAKFELPFLIKVPFKTTWESSAMKGTMNKWLETFQKHELCQKERCVSAPLTKPMGSDHCTQDFVTLVKDAKVDIFDENEVPAHMKSMMATPSILGFLDDCIYYFFEPEMTGSLRYQHTGELEVMIIRASDIVKTASTQPTSVEGMLNIIREWKPDAKEGAWKLVWRGDVKEGVLLFTPPGCCLAVKAKSLAAAVRMHIVPKTKSAFEDVDMISQVAPSKVSASYVQLLREACAK